MKIFELKGKTKEDLIKSAGKGTGFVVDGEPYDIVLLDDGKFYGSFRGNIKEIFERDIFRMTPEMLPVITYEPHSDRAILIVVDRQKQYYESGLDVPLSREITVQGPKGNQVVRAKRRRFFVVKAGENFSKFATGNSYRLVRGDEIIIADHLDGLPSFPTIEDPASLIFNECISLHYSEIAGYIPHMKKEVEAQVFPG